MKYLKLKAPKEKTKTIDELYRGMDESDLFDSKSKRAYFIKNMLPFEKGIKTRAGLDCSLGKIIDTDMFSGGENYNFLLTDCKVTLEGKRGKIGYMSAEFDDTQQIYAIFAVFGDGDTKNLGYMSFARVDDNTFYKPEGITFFTGRSENGGIFAFVSLRNYHDYSQTEYRVLEIDAGYEFWQDAVGFYVPIIYINGRGNCYEQAKAMGNVGVSAPKTLESRNLLEGRFFAYYSSDGYSNSFRLPYSSLADSAVVCRIYTDAENYIELTVREGQTKSGEAVLGDDSITMRLNREKGTVSFFSENVAFAVPVMSRYTENNIRIMAEKRGDHGFEEIVSSKISVLKDNKTYFTAGEIGNRLFCCEYENPLYFPEAFSNTVGTGDTAVDALIPCKDGLLAFKEDGVYSVRLKEGAFLNKISLLADNGKYFSDIDTFGIQKVFEEPCLLGNRTPAFLGGLPLWVTEEGNILRFKGSLDYNSFDLVRNRVAEGFTKAAVCEVWGNNYILMENQNAVIIRFEKTGVEAFVWEFPTEVSLIGACADGKDISFLCLTPDGQTVYTAPLKGRKDTVRTSAYFQKSYDITAEYISKAILSEKKVNISRIRLLMEAEGQAELYLTENGKALRYRLSQKGGKIEGGFTDILTRANRLTAPCVGIKSVGGISVKEILIYFK